MSLMQALDSDESSSRLQLSFSIQKILGNTENKELIHSQQNITSPKRTASTSEELYPWMSLKRESVVERNTPKGNEFSVNPFNLRHELGGLSKKKSRTCFTTQQVKELEAKYLKQRYLPSTERTKLADNLGLSESQVRTWFQNRRTKSKREGSAGKPENPCQYVHKNVIKNSPENDRILMEKLCEQNVYLKALLELKPWIEEEVSRNDKLVDHF